MPPRSFDDAPIECDSDAFRLVDVSDLLPTRADKRYGTRDPEGIREIVIHQTQGQKKPGRDGLMRTAEFFVHDKSAPGADPEGRGWPGFGYTFYVPFEPERVPPDDDHRGWRPVIYRCQPDNVRSYHTLHRNSFGVAIAFQGLFACRTAKDAGHPSAWQLQVFRPLIAYLCARYKRTAVDVFTHSDFNKPDCPGFDLEEKVERLREDFLVGSRAVDLRSWEQRQRALAECGFLRASEVDGVYGPRTRNAIERIEEAHGFPVTGMWPRPVDTFVRHLLEKEHS